MTKLEQEIQIAIQYFYGDPRKIAKVTAAITRKYVRLAWIHSCLNCVENMVSKTKPDNEKAIKEFMKENGIL